MDLKYTHKHNLIISNLSSNLSSSFSTLYLPASESQAQKAELTAKDEEAAKQRRQLEKTEAAVRNVSTSNCSYCIYVRLQSMHAFV